MSVERPTILLLPGMDGTGELFDPLVQAWDGDEPCAVVRYPADRVCSREELLEHIRQAAPSGQPVVLVAESFSGPLAIELTARRLLDVRALVLCCSFASSPVPLALRCLPLPGAWIRRTPVSWIRRFLAGADCPPELVARVRRCLRQVDPAVLASRMRQLARVDVREALAGVEVPLLLLTGSNDRLVGPRFAAEILDCQPGAKHLAWEGPHLLLQRRPDEAARAIRAFLEATRARRGR